MIFICGILIVASLLFLFSYFIHIFSVFFINKEQKIVFKTFISYRKMIKKYRFNYCLKEKELPYRAIYIIPDSNYNRVKMSIDHKFYGLLTTTYVENYNSGDGKYHYRSILFDPISYYVYLIYLLYKLYKIRDSRFTKTLYY